MLSFDKVDAQQIKKGDSWRLHPSDAFILTMILI